MNDPIEQLRAMSRRRAATKAQQDRDSGTATYRPDDTQPLGAYAAAPARSDVVEAGGRERGSNRKTLAGIAVGGVAGVVLALSIPALADSGTPTPSSPGDTSSVQGGTDTTGGATGQLPTTGTAGTDRADPTPPAGDAGGALPGGPAAGGPAGGPGACPAPLADGVRPPAPPAPPAGSGAIPAPPVAPAAPGAPGAPGHRGAQPAPPAAPSDAQVPQAPQGS